jgi:hypothetical protein
MHPYDWFLDNTDNCDSGLPPLPLDPLPVLEPIKVKPVELNAQLWAEWKADAEEEGCEHCGSLDINPRCPACHGIDRYEGCEGAL